MIPDTSAYAGYAKQLITVHRELRACLDRIIRRSSGEQAAPFLEMAEFVQLFAVFLLGHHQGEDEFIFAALRRHGRLRSSDVAFLEARGQEHQDVHRLCDALLRSCGAAPADGGRGRMAELARISTDLRSMLGPHLGAEEAGLTAEHLAEMVPEEVLVEAQREMVERGGQARADALRLLSHPLNRDD